MTHERKISKLLCTLNSIPGSNFTSDQWVFITPCGKDQKKATRNENSQNISFRIP